MLKTSRYYRILRHGLICAFALTLGISTGLGYWTQTYGWAQGSTIVMQLELGPTNVTLEDGSATWDSSAANALSLWNQHLESVQCAWVLASTAPKASGDGWNSVFFSSSLFGEGFGEDTLAATVYLQHDGVNTEADVVINQAFDFNSYRGPLQSEGQGATLYDIHRVFLHEFGHVLGLGHPDDSGQNVEAIMNSIITDLDHLADDDIAGVVYLYGIKVYSQVVEAFVGETFTGQVQTNIPAVSFTATGLPAGVTLDSRTGAISGTIALSGSYQDGLVTAHGLRTSGSELLWFNIAADDPLPDLRGNYYFKANRVVEDKSRSRIYASISDPPGIAVIDTATLAMISTIAVESEPYGMALSVDGKKLYIAEYREVSPIIGVIDLDNLSPLPSLPAPFPSFDVAAGSDNRLFITRLSSAGIAQMDATTGALLPAFPYGNFDGRLVISADLRTLYVGAVNYGPPTFFSVDVSTDSPALLQETPFNHFTGFIGDFKLSHDGTFLCVPGEANGGVAQLLSTDINSTIGEYFLPDLNITGSGPVAGGAVGISPDDATVFVSAYYYPTGIEPAANAIDVFNASTQRYLRPIPADRFTPRSLVTDASGRYIFAPSEDDQYVPQLRVYSTGNTVPPIHPPKPKSLLNVSTRLQSQTGDNVLIGGFIITGKDSKQVAIRGLGPSLPVTGALADPVITVYDDQTKIVGSNDNWNEQRAALLANGLAPTVENEAGLVLTLAPGSYTVVVSGAGMTSGVALVEVYDLTPDSDSSLANISTRGNVQADDNVMIGGFIIAPDMATKVLIRAIGPSLGQYGVIGALADPVLELHDGEGNLVVENDNWRSTQPAAIIATGIPPADNRESAILATLEPGSYTAIVRGQNNTTGVALIEVYNLDAGSSETK